MCWVHEASLNFAIIVEHTYKLLKHVSILNHHLQNDHGQFPNDLDDIIYAIVIFQATTS
jgi:hypothetical protein